MQIRRELGHKEWLESDGEGTDVPPRVVFRKLSAYGFWVSRLNSIAACLHCLSEALTITAMHESACYAWGSARACVPHARSYSGPCVRIRVSVHDNVLHRVMLQDDMAWHFSEEYAALPHYLSAMH